MTRPQTKPSIGSADSFIRRNARTIVNIMVFAPGFLGALLYVGGANYMEEHSIGEGLAIIAGGLALIQIARKIWNYFYGG